MEVHEKACSLANSQPAAQQDYDSRDSQNYGGHNQRGKGRGYGRGQPWRGKSGNTDNYHRDDKRGGFRGGDSRGRGRGGPNRGGYWPWQWFQAEWSLGKLVSSSFVWQTMEASLPNSKKSPNVYTIPKYENCLTISMFSTLKVKFKSPGTIPPFLKVTIFVLDVLTVNLQR